MHVNFVGRSGNFKGLKVLPFNEYDNCISSLFLSMTKVEFYKKFSL